MYAKESLVWKGAPAEVVTFELDNMKYSFVRALAQSINEEHNQRVFDLGQKRRFVLPLQGTERYPEIQIDFVTLQQRFTHFTKEFYCQFEFGPEPLEGDVEELFQEMRKLDMSVTEEDWYKSELRKRCALLDWPLC